MALAALCKSILDEEGELFEYESVSESASESASERASIGTISTETSPPGSPGPMGDDCVFIIDPSEHFRPENKDEKDFRQYTMDDVRKQTIFFLKLNSNFNFRTITFRKESEKHTKQCTHIKQSNLSLTEQNTGPNSIMQN